MASSALEVVESGPNVMDDMRARKAMRVFPEDRTEQDLRLVQTCD
jgi:hypothetical protein